MARPRRLWTPDPVSGERGRRMMEEIVEAEVLARYRGRRQSGAAGGAGSRADRSDQRATLPYIFAVRNRQLLGLVPSQFDGPPNLRRYHALITAFVQ